MEYSRRMKEARLKKGINQKELAYLVGVSPGSISAYEKADDAPGSKTPPVDVAYKIANALDVSMDWLCGKDSSLQIRTYGDLARLIEKIVELPLHIQALTSSSHYFADLGFREIPRKFGFGALGFFDEEMYEFCEGFGKLYDLFCDNIVSEDVLNAWLTVQYQVLDKKPIHYRTSNS
jgi:transcriptional regulator with XRE-family HTH domain